MADIQEDLLVVLGEGQAHDEDSLGEVDAHEAEALEISLNFKQEKI